MEYDATLLRKSLSSMGLSGGSHEVEKDPAFFNAVQGLIAFRFMRQNLRDSWVDAVRVAGERNTGFLGLLPSGSEMGWRYLGELRRQAFTYSTSDASVNGPNKGYFPWCLTQEEYDRMAVKVRAGEWPEDSGSNNDLSAIYKDFSPLVGAVIALLKQVTPKIAAVASDANVYVGTAVAISGPLITRLENVEQRQLKDAYERDADRRAYLCSKLGISCSSSNVRVTLPPISLNAQ